MTDQEKIIDALDQAGNVLAEYVEPGNARSAEQTIGRLISVLDNQDLAAAVERLKSGFGLRLVK
jgi:hypothetical protein